MVKSRLSYITISFDNGFICELASPLASTQFESTLFKTFVCVWLFSMHICIWNLSLFMVMLRKKTQMWWIFNWLGSESSHPTVKNAAKMNKIAADLNTVCNVSLNEMHFFVFLFCFSPPQTLLRCVNQKNDPPRCLLDPWSQWWAVCRPRLPTAQVSFQYRLYLFCCFHWQIARSNSILYGVQC